MNIGEIYKYSGINTLVVITCDNKKRVKTGWISVKVIATGERCRVPKTYLTKI